LARVAPEDDLDLADVAAALVVPAFEADLVAVVLVSAAGAV
jgi:hypothetical protein